MPSNSNVGVKHLCLVQPSDGWTTEQFFRRSGVGGGNGRITYNIVDHLAASDAEITSFVIHRADNASDHNPIYCDLKLQK